MKDVKNKGFWSFYLEGVICANFHGHICNQQVKTIGGISLLEAHRKFIINDFEYPGIPSFIKIK